MNGQQTLAGKVALITGASRNQGRAYAEALARRGANIVVHYNGAASKAECRRDRASRRRPRRTRRDGVWGPDQSRTPKQLFDAAFDAFGRVDVLINNAGIIIKKPIGEITEEDFDAAYAVNAEAPFLCMQQAAQRLSDDGRIVNIATSILGMSVPFYGVYAGSKASLEHFSRDLGQQLRGRGTTVIRSRPGRSTRRSSMLPSRPSRWRSSSR